MSPYSVQFFTVASEVAGNPPHCPWTQRAIHVANPAPMRSVVNPATDGELGWKGGGLQVRLSTDRTLGWPVDANSEIYYQSQPTGPS